MAALELGQERFGMETWVARTDISLGVEDQELRAWGLFSRLTRFPWSNSCWESREASSIAGTSFSPSIALQMSYAASTPGPVHRCSLQLKYFVRSCPHSLLLLIQILNKEAPPLTLHPFFSLLQG